MNSAYRIFLIFIVCSAWSCHWLYYVPNPQNVPLFREKGEVVASIGQGVGEFAITGDLQSAYAITNNIAVQANGTVWSGFEMSQGAILEIAPGYYYSFNDDFVFEVYGGMGVGETVFQFQDEEDKEDFSFAEEPSLDYYKYFLQPAIGLTKRNIDLAFSTRFCFIDFYSGSPPVSIRQPIEGLDVKRLDYFTTIDPAITMRFGWRHFKFQFQTLYSYGLYDKNINNSFHEKVNISLALRLSFGGHFNKKSGTTSPIQNSE